MNFNPVALFAGIFVLVIILAFLAFRIPGGVWPLMPIWELIGSSVKRLFLKAW